MNHPILHQNVIARLYALAWALVLLMHAAIDWLVYGLTIGFALTDALVFSFLMAFMGLSVWYPVLYIDRHKSSINLVLQLVLGGVVVITVWLYLGKWILLAVFPNGNADQVFDHRGMVMRAVVGSFQYLLLVMIYYMFMFFYELSERNQQQEKLSGLLRETELNVLKTQLNPHFLFNSLNSISALTLLDAGRARDMLTKLSDFLRYSLRMNTQAYLTLREELGNIERYLDIEKVRFGDKIHCSQSIAKECLEGLVPVLILQPILENAVKYGVYESVQPVEIIIIGQARNDTLEVKVRNTFDEEALKSKKGVGVGLENVNDRLRLSYGRSDLLSVHKAESCFEVTLKFPQPAGGKKD